MSTDRPARGRDHRQTAPARRRRAGFPVRWAAPLAAALLAAAAAGAQVVPPATPPLVPPPPPSVDPLPFSMVARWTKDLPGAPSFAPVRDATRFFVALRPSGIAAMDIATGEPAWTAPLTATAQPAVAGPRLVVAVAGSLVAIDAATGKQAWSRPIGPGVTAPLAADARQVVSCHEDGTILSLAAGDGAELWRYQAAGRAVARPVIEAATIFVLFSDGEVTSLAAGSGQPGWTSRIGPDPSGLARDRDRLYLGSRDNYLYCLDAGNGRIRWRWRSGGDIVGTPAVDGRRVYYAALDNQLYALDRGNGHQRWKRALPVRPGSGPLAFGELLLVSGLSPGIRAYRAIDGTPAGEAVAPDELAAPPLPAQPPGSEPGLLVVTGAGQARLLVPGLPAPEPVPFKK